MKLLLLVSVFALTSCATQRYFIPEVDYWKAIGESDDPAAAFERDLALHNYPLPQ